MPNSDGCISLLPLPSELLLHIFELATENSLRDLDRYVELPPFESIDSKAQEDQFDAVLKTKRSIYQTCSVFRRLCAEILYEDIRVGHGATTLADTLERSEAESPGVGLGRMVKRAVLFPLASECPAASDGIGWHTRRILNLCPNIRATLRTKITISNDEAGVTRSDPSADGTQLFPSLERIDWLSCPADDPPVVAEMPQSIWSSESLKTLSVRVKEWSRFTGMQETEIIDVISTIQTLRVRSVDAFGLPGQRLFTLQLPSLRRLILDQPDSLYALFGIVVHYAEQIETLEFGLHSGFLEHDYIMVLLVYCPSTIELYFPVFTTFVTRSSGTQGAAFAYDIRHVIMHAAVEKGSEDDDAWKWEHLTAHFETLCGDNSRFTKLERITLYGTEWRALVGDARLGPSLCLIQSRGVRLLCEDEEVRLLLERNNATDSMESAT